MARYSKLWERKIPSGPRGTVLGMEGSPWGRMGQHYESNSDEGSKPAREGLIKGKDPVWESGNVGKGKCGRRLGSRRRIVWWETWEEGGNGADGGGIFFLGLGGGKSKIVVASVNSELGKFALIFRFGSKLYKLPDTASRSCYCVSKLGVTFHFIWTGMGIGVFHQRFVRSSRAFLAGGNFTEYRIPCYLELLR